MERRQMGLSTPGAALTLEVLAQKVYSMGLRRELRHYVDSGDLSDSASD